MKKTVTLFSIIMLSVIMFTSKTYSQGGMRGGGELEAGVSISVDPGTFVCAGTMLTFYASPITGGPGIPGLTYSFQWQVNGVDVGLNEQSYSTNNLQDGDYVWVIMTTTESGVEPVLDTSDIIMIHIDYNSTWTGAVSSAWEDPANWSCNVVPTGQTNVTIPHVTNLPVIASDTAVCNNIIIEDSASITVNANCILTVNGEFTNNGLPSTGEGFIVFEGGLQNLNGSVVIHNMIVQPGSVVSTVHGSNQEISGILLVNGILYIDGNLTLLSNENSTALIDGNSLGNIYGQVTQQRYVSASKAKGYKQFSSAFSDASIGQFGNFMNLVLGGANNSPFPTIFKYSEAHATNYFGGGWVAAANPGETQVLLEKGRGYTCQFGTGGPNPITSALYGNVNHGDVSVPITFLNPGNIKGNGWNLVGNPYPSPIDLNKLPFDAANINKSVSIFVSTSMYNGYYGYYNANIGLALNGGTRYLPALHAFFVQCNNPSGSTLTFTNSMRANVLSPQLYKNEEVTEYPYIKLSASSSEPASIKDETAIVFSEIASEGYDEEFDISKILNNDSNIPNFYSLSNGNQLAFNGLHNNFDNIIEIPLGFAVQSAGLYTINAEEIANLNHDLSIILEDIKYNKTIDLGETSSYTFSFDENEASEGRFILKIGNALTSITVNDNSVVFAAWQNENSITVKIRGQKTRTGKIEILDGLGRVVFSNDIYADGDYMYNPNINTGTYFIRYFNGEEVIVKKMFIR